MSGQIHAFSWIDEVKGYDTGWTLVVFREQRVRRTPQLHLG